MMSLHNAMGCAACIYRLSRLPLGVSVAAFETAFSFARPGPSTGSTRLYSTNFQPAPPPGTHGTPVFPNIDFAVATEPNSESQKRNSDPGAVFVVSGSNRGIGLQFVKSLTERSKGTIVALCRTPASATSLNNYIASSQHDRIQVVQLDLENQSSIANAGKEIRDKYQRVDLLLNVAGILGDGRTTPGPERSLAKLNRDWLQKTLAINLVGPAMLSKELLPLLLGDRRKQKDSSRQQRPTAIVANLSARVGSIADNGLGGWYSYRMSKSAMNQYTRTLALELKRHSAWTVALHPGTTDTDLSVPFQANVKEGSLFPVEFTVNQLLDVIDSMTEEHSGGFYDWSGQSLSF